MINLFLLKFRLTKKAPFRIFRILFCTGFKTALNSIAIAIFFYTLFGNEKKVQAMF